MSVPLVRSSLRFYWRGHVALLLGVATTVAVLAGALLVGASVRASLADRAGARHGRTNRVHAAQTPFPAGRTTRLAPRLSAGAGDVAERVGSLISE